MKTKKFLAGILAAVMVLSLAVVPASAATYPDIQKHWAKPYIETMTTAGLFQGYTDGTFRPEVTVDNSIALATCARMAVPKEMRAIIGKDRAKEMEQLLPTPANGKNRPYYWYIDEFATCLELGIVSYGELATLIQNGSLQKPAGKAQLACYLVRAMGLESTVRGLGTVVLNFADASEIPAQFQPYVYLLNIYGVVDGTPENKFLPNSSVNRAVAATMLSRAMTEMKNKGINTELPRYTTYKWDAGYITDTSAGTDGAAILALKSDITGAKSITVPAAAMIYQDNRSVERTALKVGAYARVCYKTDGTVESVRVIAADRMEKATGTISSLTADGLVMGGKTYAMNRFTEVEAGSKTGDRNVIDYGAGYSSAVMTIDSVGNILDLKLSGGTRTMEGILTGVTTTPSGVTTIELAAYNGTTQRLTVPSTAVVTATGNLPLTLTSGHVGRHLTLRVDNANVNQISSIAVDTASKYVQGVLRSVNNKVTPSTVTIGDAVTNRQTTYAVSAECAMTYSDKATALTSLVNGSYVTIKVEGAMVTELSAWPGAAYTEGKLTGITYGEPTILMVTRADGAVVSFEIKLADMENVEILRDDKKAAITQIQTGDTITVTVQYNTVTRIEAKPQSANVTGTVQALTFNMMGTQLTLQLSDGSSKVYTAASGISVTQDGSVIQMTALTIGTQVAMVTSGDQILSIEVTGRGTSNTKLEGTVYQVTDRTKVTLLVGNTPVVVNIPGNLNITDTATGNTVRVSSLKLGDSMIIWGTYNKQEFVATAAVRVG
ncbi:MAG: S-layer homology domain-containing protein [Oscillospiraceae bacterium]